MERQKTGGLRLAQNPAAVLAGIGLMLGLGLILLDRMQDPGTPVDPVGEVGANPEAGVDTALEHHEQVTSSRRPTAREVGGVGGSLQAAERGQAIESLPISPDVNSSPLVGYVALDGLRLPTDGNMLFFHGTRLLGKAGIHDGYFEIASGSVDQVLLKALVPGYVQEDPVHVEMDGRTRADALCVDLVRGASITVTLVSQVMGVAESAAVLAMPERVVPAMLMADVESVYSRASVSCNTERAYVLHDLHPSRTYEIQVHRREHPECEVIYLRHACPGSSYKIELPRDWTEGTSISGQVLSQSSEPVAGASVGLLRASVQSVDLASAVAVGNTDQVGRFSFMRVAPGDYVLLVMHPETVPSLSDLVTSSSDVRDLTIQVLPRDGQRQILALLPDGSPCVGASVSVRYCRRVVGTESSTSVVPSSGVAFSCTTNDAGLAFLPTLAGMNAPCQVRVDAGDGRLSGVSLGASDGIGQPFVIQVSDDLSGASLRVRVLDAWNEPIAGLPVEVLNCTEDIPVVVLSTITDGEAICANDVVGGFYSIRVKRPDQLTNAYDLVLSNGERKDLVVVLRLDFLSLDG